jgi:hypothetical protein
VNFIETAQFAFLFLFLQPFSPLFENLFHKIIGGICLKLGNVVLNGGLDHKTSVGDG